MIIGGGKEKALPDIIAEDLKILFVGFNPGIRSAETKHHYAGSSNRFWKLLHESGLTPRRLAPEEDRCLLDFGYGSTNIADRPTRRSDELTREELNEGCRSFSRLIEVIKPEITCYMGIGIYRILISYAAGIPQSRIAVSTGLQKERLFSVTADYVCSNPSGLNTISWSLQVECLKGLKALLVTNGTKPID